MSLVLSREESGRIEGSQHWQPADRIAANWDDAAANITLAANTKQYTKFEVSCPLPASPKAVCSSGPHRCIHECADGRHPKRAIRGAACQVSEEYREPPVLMNGRKPEQSAGGVALLNEINHSAREQQNDSSLSQLDYCDGTETKRYRSASASV